MFVCRHYIDSLAQLFAPFGLSVTYCEPTSEIPGSFWGSPEAGLVGDKIYLRADTPIHSALHEASHFVCMDSKRRCNLRTDAGGDDEEEAAVCFLQVLLADFVEGFGRAHCLVEMDEWGYSFRLGTAKLWFECDAGDANAWLQTRGLLDDFGNPSWRLRV